MKAQKTKMHLIKVDDRAYAILNAYQNKIVQDTKMKPTFSQLIYAVFELAIRDHQK
jgi:hypothetical protein|uniref:Uncharacterized protein n=1 Tax=uncultured microorganism TaxID=358574 RepID=A0A1L3KS68_9ZZZZ|nr:hypothetical protein [uncultured microorganism]